MELLNNGFSLQQSLNLLKDNDNKMIFNSINLRLNQGEDIKNVFFDYCPSNIRSYFKNLISFLPFQISLKLSVNTMQKGEAIKKYYFKNLFYPLTILLLTILGIYFFTLLFFPVLINMMNEFNADTGLSLKLQVVIMVFINVLFSLLIVILLLLLIFINKKHQVKLYKLMAKFKFSKIIKLFISNEFAIFYRQCSNLGCSTRQCISILKSFSDKPVIAFIADNIEKSFNSGYSMEKAFNSIYLDKSLYRFIRISNYVSNTDEMLLGYLKVNEIKINNFIKKLIYFVKFFSYISIASILIFVYQVLLLPLSILSNL